jgi:outer membrane protein
VRRFGLTILTLLVPTALAAQASADSVARPIALAEAVKLAQRNSPTTVQASGTTRSNAASVRSAYMAFIPSLSFSTGASKQSGDRIGQQGTIVPYTVTAFQYSSGLNMNVDIFDGGNRLFRLRAAKANVDAAEANETLQQYNVALNVKQQYYAVLAARESESAAKAQLDQAQEQLKTASAKVAAGAATKSDSLRAVIQVGNAQLALIQARNNLNIANASLTRLVATPFVVTATPGDTTESIVLAADSADVARLAMRGPAVVQSEEAYAAARANVRGALTPYLPTVSARFNRSGAGQDSRFGWGTAQYPYSQTLSFSLNFPFFNQGAREEQVVRTRVAEDVAQAQLRDTRLLAQQQLTQYMSAFRSAEQRVQIQLASVAAAEEDLRVQQRRYQLGASTFLDVLTSQSTLDQARAALIQARFDARVAKAQIETLTGKDM